jgi:hypothetical protein
LGAGFLGKTSIVVSGLYSSGLSPCMTDSIFSSKDEPCLPACLLSHEDMKIKSNGRVILNNGDRT